MNSSTEPIVIRVPVISLGSFNLQKLMTYRKKNSSKKQPSRYSIPLASNASSKLVAVATHRYPKLMTGINTNMIGKCTEIPLLHLRTNIADKNTDSMTVA